MIFLLNLFQVRALSNLHEGWEQKPTAGKKRGLHKVIYIFIILDVPVEHDQQDLHHAPFAGGGCGSGDC